MAENSDDNAQANKLNAEGKATKAAALPAWTDIVDWKEVESAATYSKTLVGDFGSTSADFAKTKFEAAVKTDAKGECHIEMKHSIIPVVMKIGTHNDGKAYPTAAVNATISHETVHLNKLRIAKDRIDAGASTLDAALQSNKNLKGGEKKAIAGAVVKSYQALIDKYYKARLIIENFRQEWHLDHLKEEIRKSLPDGTVVGAGVTYQQYIKNSSTRANQFKADAKTATGKTYATVDDAVNGLNQAAAALDNYFLGQVTKIKNAIAGL